MAASETEVLLTMYSRKREQHEQYFLLSFSLKFLLFNNVFGLTKTL